MVGDGDADDGNFEFVGAFDHLYAVEHNDIARGDRQAGPAVFGEVLDGLETDGGDIGSAVVLGAGALGEGPAAAFAEGGCSLDHAIGAFDGFDGDYIQIADCERLPDVESEEFSEHGPDEIDVGLLGSGRLCEGHDAGLGELALDGDGRVDE